MPLQERYRDEVKRESVCMSVSVCMYVCEYARADGIYELSSAKQNHRPDKSIESNSNNNNYNNINCKYNNN